MICEEAGHEAMLPIKDRRQMSEYSLTEPVRLAYLRPGDGVHVTCRGEKCFGGIIDEISSTLGLVWIREPVMGERKLFSPPEYAFHRIDGTPSHRPGSGRDNELEQRAAPNSPIQQ